MCGVQDPSHIQVLIKVEDLDDNIPEFVGGNVTVGVRLNVAPHTAVVTLRAADADPGAAPLRYLLAAASFQSPIQVISFNSSRQCQGLRSNYKRYKIT